MSEASEASPCLLFLVQNSWGSITTSPLGIMVGTLKPTWTYPTVPHPMRVSHTPSVTSDVGATKCYTDVRVWAGCC